MTPRSTAASSAAPRPTGMSPGGGIAVGAALVFVLVLVLFAVRGADARSYVCWLLGPVVGGFGAVTAGGGLRVGRTAWVLRRRGVVAEGRPAGTSEAVAVADWAQIHVSHRYVFTDAEGREHERSGPVGGVERADILYDPRDPRTNKVHRGTAGWLTGAALLLAVGVPMVAAAAGLMVWAVVHALGLG
ncbi:hypothetical protein ABZ023_26300 [Streptomyces sp. NPDC006367]|uniref:hypothetical protein n=1 Tax=unclassified Streptomyces TaxID=2593676 RepID=UPI0033BF74E8